MKEGDLISKDINSIIRNFLKQQRNLHQKLEKLEDRNQSSSDSSNSEEEGEEKLSNNSNIIIDNKNSNEEMNQIPSSLISTSISYPTNTINSVLLSQTIYIVNILNTTDNIPYETFYYHTSFGMNNNMANHSNNQYGYVIAM
jgi:hypothetical protein